jgi:uncharacterized protein
MNSEKFFNMIKKPDMYGDNIKKVDLIQTHISYVALTGEYAYKIKKPVNFGFLDFSTLEKRKYFCEEELRLNRRLCPEIYLDVVSINKKNDKLELNGDGDVVDYAVKMKEFSQKNIMSNLLKNDKISDENIENICSVLVDFYNKTESSDEIDKYGSVESIKKNTDENFEQTRDFIGKTISKEKFDFIKKNTNSFLENKELFSKRIKKGFISDCHGDLHTGNIVISDGNVCIFDCIEFNKRFRYSDVASDIAFLAMDLDFLGYPYLSSVLIEKYVEESKDEGIFDVLNFYKCYRAYVRGKVISFKLNDPNIEKKEKIETIDIASKYFDLACFYAKLFSKKTSLKPVLFITTGLTGTGKTTIAKKFKVDYNAFLISTDSVRKELAGVDKYERHHDAYNTGMYSPEKMMQTYTKIFEKAAAFLSQGRNVVLDATFKTKNLREKAEETAFKNNANFLALHCNTSEENVKKYLESRVKKKSISDGRWEIYVKQKDSFEIPGSDENHVKIDVSNSSSKYQMDIFSKVFEKVFEEK